MNTGMWEHPLTRAQLQIVKAFWNEKNGTNKICIVEPKTDSKLACGEIGAGAMADVQCIVNTLKDLLKEEK